MKSFPCPWCLHATPGGYVCSGQCDMSDDERRVLAEKMESGFDRDSHPWAYRGICPSCGKGDSYTEFARTEKDFAARIRECEHCRSRATVAEWVSAEDTCQE